MKIVGEKEEGLLQPKSPYPFFFSLGFITHDKPFFKPFKKRFIKNASRKERFTKEIKKKTGRKGAIIGGASVYSAILARNFGVASAIATSIGEDFEECNSLKGIRSAYQIGERTTTFINKPFKEREEATSGRRIQYITSVADRIKEETIPKEWFNAEIVYICPVLNELEEEIIKRFEGSMIGVAPQGWMRSVGEGGRIEKKKWEKANEVLSKVDFVIVSEEDVFEEDVPKYAELSNILVLTRGRKGAELYCDSHEHIPAFEREEVDATGAGDVFGAAFLLRYYETKDAVESAIFASCAASFVVEKEGVEGVPFREAVIERMEKERGVFGSF